MWWQLVDVSGNPDISFIAFWYDSQKENLIANCAQSEQEAKITTEMYKERLAKLEKEYEKSEKELEEAQRKITAFESAGD